MISDVYGINGTAVMMEVLGKSRTETLLWCRDHLSGYSFEANGEEIISEVFAAYYGSSSPAKEIIDFVSKCDKMIIEWRQSK